MNISQRIYLGSGNTSNVGNDAHIKVKLEQNIDSIEFLSMSIDAEDVYQNFNSDYGVLVGKVIANDGIGVPNVKISIFIPLTDEDSLNNEITSIYPYTTPREKNNEGKRYNLLPRVSKINPDTKEPSPKQPFGSFPIKEEIVTNSNILKVYKKYYKYTALTNNAGDYMIFGVPVGTQTVHMSVDITDIGEFSMNPASMVTNLGYSPNLFTDNNTRIKPSNDLNDLPNIETQEISVDIIPFWGDTENFEIGITRQDFRIRSVLNNTFVLFGSAFTDSNDTIWGDDSNSSGRHINELYTVVGNNLDDKSLNISITGKRIGKITEKIYYYPPEISDYDIDNMTNNADPSKMAILDKSQYSIYKRDGDFVFIISCNRKKVTKNEYGITVEIPYDSVEGVFTEFRGFVTLEFLIDDIPISTTSAFGSNTKIVPMRYKFKFPQHANAGKSFEESDSNSTDLWRRQHFKFKANNFYSFSRFHGITFNDYSDDNNQFNTSFGFFKETKINTPHYNLHQNVGVIVTSDFYSEDDKLLILNSDYHFPSNAYSFNVNPYIGTVVKGDLFGANWMNFSIYLPQIGYVEKGFAYIKDVRVVDNFTAQKKDDAESNSFYIQDNRQEIAANDTNTKWFARSDFHWTDIVEVPILDIKEIFNKGKGFKYNPKTESGISGKYRNGEYIPSEGNWTAACPFNGGKQYGIFPNPNPTLPDPYIYFYKGIGSSDCIKYLYDLGLINK